MPGTTAEIPPLLYADTPSCPDALYYGGVEMSDPFICFGHGGRRHAVVSALEFGRVRRTSRFDVVQPLDAFRTPSRRRGGHPARGA